VSPPLEDALAAAPSIAAARTALEERASQVWIVGGAIRDALLDRQVADADLAVERGTEGTARADAARERLRDLGALDPDAVAAHLVPWPG
jgi:tRNA nucleotidyltransferase/poly(A) polymerase